MRSLLVRFLSRVESLSIASDKKVEALRSPVPGAIFLVPGAMLLC